MSCRVFRLLYFYVMLIAGVMSQDLYGKEKPKDKRNAAIEQEIASSSVKPECNTKALHRFSRLMLETGSTRMQAMSKHIKSVVPSANCNHKTENPVSQEGDLNSVMNSEYDDGYSNVDTSNNIMPQLSGNIPLVDAATVMQNLSR